MNTPNNAWIALFSRSPRSRLLWRIQTGLSAPLNFSTRWWSQFEVSHSMLNTFSDVKKFLERDDLRPATSTKLLQVLDDPAKTRKLKIEIATTVDAMEPFVKATYKLEGDGPLSLEAYQQHSILLAFVSTQHYPNGNASHEQQLLDYSKACVQPAYDYFYLKFNNVLKPVLDAFKAARLFSPFKFHKSKPSATDIDCLKAFPLLSSQETIDGLKMKISMITLIVLIATPFTDALSRIAATIKLEDIPNSVERMT